MSTIIEQVCLASALSFQLFSPGMDGAIVPEGGCHKSAGVDINAIQDVYSFQNASNNG
ncbi:hypothetical protein BJX61DRAFT_522723 [Aspergillus egyptiacus]|nr:hypothetical protein BJX61DRAFT_522723 [Aspergillus egyptiacus]